MTAIDVEDRIRQALTDLAATTTTSPDARERISARAKPRGSRVRVALLAAAGLAVIVAGLVFVAVVVRGPASSGDDSNLRSPAPTSTLGPTPPTTLPEGTTTWTFTGEDDGTGWTLEARRFPNGQVDIEARSDSVTAGFQNPQPDRVFVTAATGGSSDVPLVVGSTPPSASSAQVTLAGGTVLPIDVLGDGEGIGVRVFAIALPAGTTGTLTFEAFAADGASLGTSEIPFR